MTGCCIYERPKTFDESSSEDSDDECEHCHGHKDAHKKVLPKTGNAPQDGMSSHPGNFLISSINYLITNTFLSHIVFALLTEPIATGST